MFLFQTPTLGKDKPQAGPSKSPSVAEIRNKLLAAAKEVRPSPSFTESLTPGFKPLIERPPSLCSFRSPQPGETATEDGAEVRELCEELFQNLRQEGESSGVAFRRSLVSIRPFGPGAATVCDPNELLVVTDSRACAIVPHTVLIPHAAPFTPHKSVRPAAVCSL